MNMWLRVLTWRVFFSRTESCSIAAWMSVCTVVSSSSSVCDRKTAVENMGICNYLGQLLGLGELLVDFLGEVLLRLERSVRHDV